MNKQFFGYSTGPIAIAAAVGAVGNGQISVAADADFEVQYLLATVIQATLVVVNWGGTIQIDDSAVGRTFWNQAVPIQAVTGDGRQPFVLLTPRLVKANSTLTVTLVNNAATATTVHVVLQGYKLFN